MPDEKAFEALLDRVRKLENAVFSGQEPPTGRRKGFSGATGGLRMLVSEGFFDQKRNFSEIEIELCRKNYHYSKQAIQTPLNRLSKAGGPLVGFKEKGKKVYAKRR